MKPTIIYIDNFLTAHGHTPTTGIGLVKLFKDVGFKVKSTSNKRNKIVRMVDMLSTIFINRKNSIALIATYSTSAFYFAWSCAKLCKFLNVPFIPCLHGGNLPQRIMQSPNKSAQLFGAGFTNVTVSGYLGEAMKKQGWSSTEIPNFIFKEDYPFQHRQNVAPRLLWVRSFHKIYNPELAIHILYLLQQKYPEATLTMVGPAKDDSLLKCQRLARKLQVEKSVTFQGVLLRQEWVKLSAQHHIFLNTTNFDNLPVSVIEAMALGLVVISTNVGGLPFLIRDRFNGLLVPKNDAASFIKAIEAVLNDDKFSGSLSMNAHATAMQYDYAAVKNKWLTLLNSIPSIHN